MQVFKHEVDQPMESCLFFSGYKFIHCTYLYCFFLAASYRSPVKFLNLFGLHQLGLSVSVCLRFCGEETPATLRLLKLQAGALFLVTHLS